MTDLTELRHATEEAEAFNKLCEANEYTDSGDHWTITTALTEAARAVLDAQDPARRLPSRLAVAIEGGLVSAVVSNRPEDFEGVEVLIIDYDTEGAGDCDVFEVPQEDCDTSTACGHFEVVAKSGVDLAAAFANAAALRSETPEDFAITYHGDDEATP